MRTPDIHEKRAIAGVKLIHSEEHECHALANREYAVLYIMQRGGERRIFETSASFHIRIPRFSPLMWLDAAMDSRTPAQIAAELLEAGRFPLAATLLGEIAAPEVNREA